MRAKASRCPALSVTATHTSTARLRASSSAAAAARWPRASLTGPGCSRSLFLEPEADLHRHLEGRSLARRQSAPDLGHLEPVHVPQGLLGRPRAARTAWSMLSPEVPTISVTRDMWSLMTTPKGDAPAWPARS